VKGLVINNQGIDLAFSQAECIKQEKKGKANSALWQTKTYLGWALVEDGVLKYTENDANMINEMLAHSMLLAHSFAKDVLVVGAADGLLVKYILKHTSVRKLDWVISHQPSFDIAKAHFDIDALKNHEKVNVIEDAPLDYLRSNNALYDVAFSDHALHGSHQLEQTHDYYQALSNHMKATGILIFTSGLWAADQQAIMKQKKMVQEHFPQCGISAIPASSKVGGLQTWIWAANKDLSMVDVSLLHAKMEISPFQSEYYSTVRHQAFFNPLIETADF
jgi:spermidine synthase